MLQQHPELKPPSPLLRAGLLAKADAMKQALSLEEQASATIEWDGRQWHWTLTESILRDCCKTLLTRLQRPIQQALHDARLSLHDLDHILLVGGATRMRIVRQTVARLFGRFPRHDLNPDEAIALGAGIQAGMVMNDSAVEDIILTDVMPFSLGVEVVKRHAGQIEAGFFPPLIERNTFLPVSKLETLNTVEDNQTMVLLKIYQGEGRRVKENVFLGEMQVEVPPRRAGEVELDVRFTYTLDGLLEVECSNKGEQTVSRLVIEKIPGQMSEEQIAASLEKLTDLKQHPRDRQENQLLLARCSRLYEQLLGEERRWIDELMTAFEQALDSQDIRSIAAMRERVEQFLRQYDEVPRS